jgi:hypothetical protein
MDRSQVYLNFAPDKLMDKMTQAAGCVVAVIAELTGGLEVKACNSEGRQL